jgi:flavin-dependent dehydrogenase
VPTSQAHVDIQFFPQFEGYIWVFPRCEHLSVGICGKGVSAKELRLWLERYMNEKGIPFKDAEFYGHMLPSLETPNWKRNRLAGDGWLAAGDAAGLVDPITGEGLYYAIRSGDLAGEIILDRHHAAEGKPAAYSALVRQDFLADLEYGSTLAKRFFTGRFLFSGATTRMVDFMKRSPRFHELMQDLFAGTQDYLSLKQRLFSQLQFTLREVMVNGFLRRIVVG